MKTIKQLVVLAIAGALISGCSTTSYEKADHTATSLQNAAQVIDESRVQIDAVLAALSDLVTTPEADLKPQFKNFASLMDELESLYKDVREEAGDMQTAGAGYFKKWDEDLAKIHSEDIRARSAERKNDVSARFDRVKATYQRVNTDFAPFMSDLKDVRTALGADLTAGGLASISDVVRKANRNVVPLRESLAELSTEFKELGVSLTATTPQPTR